MKPEKLLTTLAIIGFVLIAGCKKDDNAKILGLYPLVISNDPVNLTKDIPLNKIITVTFNENINPVTITSTSFTLETAAKGGSLVTGVVSCTGAIASFTPSSDLLPGTTYTGTVKATVKDLHDNILQSNCIWTFTTSAIPIVTSTDPLNLATNVALNKVISANFSMAMDPLTITTSTFSLMDGVTPVSGTVNYSNTIATFTPGSALILGKTYTATITAGAKNVQGITLANKYIWTFSTGSVIVPTVISNDPLNLATNVALNKVISADFSAPMDPLTITTSTFTLMDGATPVSGVVNYAGTTATFTPGSALILGKTYTATITAGAKNVQGITLANKYIWTFSTGSVIVPTVISNDPLNLATNVALNKVISADFSAPMDPLTITTSTFTLMDGATPVSGVVNYAGTTATFTPGSALILGKTYTATITAGAKNVQGITLANKYIWTFSTGSVIVPTVISNDPLNLATNVALNKVISADFSAPMDPLTITTSTFTLMDGATPVSGAVNYAGTTATFTPGSALLAGKTYTATITTGAKNIAGTPIASAYVWTFSTIPQTFTLAITAINGTVIKHPDQLTYDYGTVVELTATPDAGYVFTSWSGDATGIISPKSIIMNANKNVTANFTLLSAVCTKLVDLGLSGDYVILSESGISTTGVTAITGNMGISPAAATYITGFGLILPAGGAFSTSSLVTGNIYAPGYAAPTPTNLTTAVTNMSTAFTTANGLAPTVTELLAGNLSGQTLAPGVYKWSTGLLITTGLTLDGGGDPCASWVFQVAGDLTVANSAIITLANGAKSKNIFWVVAGSKAQLGTGVDFSGNILCKTLISLNTGAKVLGRLLAQTAVTLNASTVVLPQ